MTMRYCSQQLKCEVNSVICKLVNTNKATVSADWYNFTSGKSAGAQCLSTDAGWYAWLCVPVVTSFAEQIALSD